MAALLSSWLLPACFLLGFILTFRPGSQPWRAARGAAVLGLASTLITLALAVTSALYANAEPDTLGLTMTALISLLSWVIINYSFRYLQGEPNQLQFVRAMLATLTCVGVLIVSHNLLAIVLAWSGTSFGLHYLLTFYRERKAAQIVAHKKFIASRLADLCLL
ncbi:MAG TPA: NADH-quinone oxidoreductase subunit L, partial [Pseudomonadales bacterium]|nr:NADH-quinone oxidoreductase subunit L [Pseudomonadales bacterium]